MKLPDKLYDTLKWICLIGLPATALFLVTVLSGAGVDEATIKLLITTIGAVQTFLGSLIGISTAAYKADNALESIKVGGTD